MQATSAQVRNGWRERMGFRREAVAVDSSRLPSEAVSDVAARPRLLALDASEHARELLHYLARPGGVSGSVPASVLADEHARMCAELEIEAIGWIAVGRELRKLLGQRKIYHSQGRRRQCVYRIPPAGENPLPRAAARFG